LVFLDEAGANLAMGRSHAWVKHGEAYVEARPMNWGDNLTLVGAIRRRGWVVLNTKWRAMNTPSLHRLGPSPSGAPPDSHDFNPIEPAWSLVKRRIRDDAPRTREALRRVAGRARYVVHRITAANISRMLGTSIQVHAGIRGPRSITNTQ
jgi:hypothetical protein